MLSLENAMPVLGGPASLLAMPRHWFWTQVLIVVFVLAGMIIAITKLA